MISPIIYLYYLEIMQYMAMREDRNYAMGLLLMDIIQAGYFKIIIFCVDV